MLTPNLKNEMQVTIVGNLERGSLNDQLNEFEKYAPVCVIPPVIIDDLDSLSSEYFDLNRFQIMEGRNPLSGEIGCAAAHVNACQRVMESDANWVLVLEDDAEVTNVHALISRCEEIIGSCGSEQPLVVSFHTRKVQTKGLGPQLAQGVHLLPVAISFTVCYLMNKNAARLLIRSQTPIQSPSDWPVGPPEIGFAIDTDGFVGHPHHNVEKSLIGPLENRTSSKLIRFQIWSGIWYLKHRKTYGSFENFHKYTFKKRLYYHAYVMTPRDRGNTIRSCVAFASTLLWRILYGLPSKFDAKIREMKN